MDCLYEDGLPYYKVLGYPHGPGDNCQASPDFVGGRFFHYVLFHVKENGVTVYTYGIDPVEGSSTEIPDNYIVELKDTFEIKTQ